MLPINPITSYMRPNAYVSAEWTRYFASQIPIYASPNPSTGIIPPTGSYQGGYNCNDNINFNRLINCVDPDGWKGVLMGNLAQIDAKSSWSFFAGQDGVGGAQAWDWSWTAGNSRTWYLAVAAAFGGAG